MFIIGKMLNQREFTDESKDPVLHPHKEPMVVITAPQVGIEKPVNATGELRYRRRCLDIPGLPHPLHLANQQKRVKQVLKSVPTVYEINLFVLKRQRMAAK